ncbi:MAG: galactokinase, partial [Anaerotignum sp.]|nr:galactokinase [Anaerotignum sp.]
MNLYGINEEALHLAYPRFTEDTDFYLGRIEQVKKGFSDTYGKENPRIFSAPGRTEIGGNHTDHQHGCVLAAAVDMDILAAALPNGTKKIRILSEGFAPDEVDLTALSIKEDEINTSAALIRGVAAKLTELGYDVEGFDLYATSNVLKGSGLSSSAAYEVMLGHVMNGLFCNNEISAVDIARIGQYAENVYFGKKSGLMDQTASSVGGVVAIDFRDNSAPVVKKLDFRFETSGYSLCIIDSGADHADLSDEYSAIPTEMKQVAAMLGTEVLREADEALFVERLAEIRKETGDRAVLRALHFFRENRRAVQEAELLEAGDFDAFLNVVKESGQSSNIYLQNVKVEGQAFHQEVQYALAVCDMLLDGKGAFRVHGGGFAGTVQAFVPNDMLEAFRTGAEKMVGKGSCHVLSIREAG